MNRINWIDELKGFILILICLGHTHINIPFLGENLITICQAFSLPTFFFLSGLLFSTHRYSNINSYLRRKIRVLLVPYILLSLLFSFLDPRLYNLSLIERNDYLNTFFSSADIHSNLEYLIIEFKSIFYYGLPIITGPLWFVLALFLVSVLFFTAHHVFHGNIKCITIYAAFCLIIGWILNLHDLTLPYCFSTVFTASFFFSFGYLVKK